MNGFLDIVSNFVNRNVQFVEENSKIWGRG